MSCNNCGCLDCTRQRGIDRAMNRSNVTDENLDDGWATPIHRSPVAKVEPPNEGQVKVWVQIAHEVFNEYKVSSIPLSTLSSLVAQRIPGLRSENYYRVLAQVAEAIKSHPDFEYRRGKSGGIFKRQVSGGIFKRQVPGGSDRSFVPQACSQGNDPSFGEPIHLIDEMSKAPKEVQGHALRMIKSGTLPPPMPEVVAINDHICPGCGNDKCSKSERTCWKCGAAL